MKLSAGRKLCFGVGALGKDLCYAMISTYLMIYLTDTVGLAPLFVGNLFLVARVWDAVNDPMMGFIVDNTRSRWGKFRPWILIGTLINAGILILLFMGPQLQGFKLYAYYSVMYILWGMSYTIMDIPYWSMLPSMSSTKEERDSMSVIPRIFASSAWLLVGAFGLAMINRLGQGDEAKGYASSSVVVAIIFVATILVTVIFARDRSSLEAGSGEKGKRTSLKEAIHVITANDQLKVYIGVVLAYNLVVQLAGGMALYYFKYVTQDENLFPYFTTAASFAEMGALFLFPILSRFLSKKQVFAIASFTPAVGLTISGFVENVPQTETTIMGMRILMGVVPSIITVLAYVIYVRGYKLEGSYLESITAQLKSKKVEV